MAKILDEAKSNIGSPYVFYTIYADEIANSRTVDSVQIDVTVYSHLQYNQSYLGSGYPLTGYLTLNGTEYSIALKSSGDTWSGTTSHRSDAQFTVSNLTSSATKIENVKFRVSSRSSSDSGYMSSKSCSDIAIAMGHIPPNVNTYTLTEQNALLTNAGVSNDVFVDNLSQKQITLTYELHDSATATNYGIYNGTTPYLYDTNPFLIDLSSISLTKSNNKIPIRYALKDSLGSQGLTSEVLYDNVPYTKISITNSSTIAKRVGQISGQVAISINGSFFNGTVGNVDQSSYKPTLKYKFWKVGDTEPSTYANTISASDITISDNTFNVSSLNIGSTTEGASNYFDPEYAWRIKVYAEDNFTSIESNELQIQVGESIWDEYKDRVNFKKATVKGGEIGRLVAHIEDENVSSVSLSGLDLDSDFQYEMWIAFTPTSTGYIGMLPNGKSTISNQYIQDVRLRGTSFSAYNRISSNEILYSGDITASSQSTLLVYRLSKVAPTQKQYYTVNYQMTNAGGTASNNGTTWGGGQFRINTTDESITSWGVQISAGQFRYISVRIYRI